MPLSPLQVGNKPTPRELIPIRVLVVDDEALIRWSVCSALATAGFDAMAARSADEACALAAEWPPPQVVVLDRGAATAVDELMSKIRRIHPDCRFLLMSTSASRGSGAEVDGVRTVQKPFDLAVLVRLVREAVKQEASS